MKTPKFVLAVLLVGGIFLHAAYGAIEIVAPGFSAGSYQSATLTPTLEWYDSSPSFGNFYKVTVTPFSYGGSAVAIWTQTVSSSSSKTDYSAKYAGPALSWDSAYLITVEKRHMSMGGGLVTTDSASDYFITVHVVISSISGSSERVTIQNKSAYFTADLTDWLLTDGYWDYEFPSFTLAAGGTVYVHTGDGTDSSTDLYWGYDRAVWNDDGDTGYLYDDRDQYISKYSY